MPSGLTGLPAPPSLPLLKGRKTEALPARAVQKWTSSSSCGEVDCAAPLPEQVLRGQPGGLVLLNGVLEGLAGEPVLQLNSGDGQAVNEQRDVYGALLDVVAVPELSGYREPVLQVALFGQGIARGECAVETR